MPFLSINELHQLTGKTRATVTKHLDGVSFKDGPKKAMLYDSQVALERLYRGESSGDDGEPISKLEAERQLTIARKNQIDLEMEVTRGDRWPKDDVESIHEASLSNIAGLLKSHEGKPLSAELIRDIFTELREVPAKLTKL
jgi:hypothetical protein